MVYCRQLWNPWPPHPAVSFVHNYYVIKPGALLACLLIESTPIDSAWFQHQIRTELHFLCTSIMYSLIIKYSFKTARQKFISLRLEREIQIRSSLYWNRYFFNYKALTKLSCLGLFVRIHPTRGRALRSSLSEPRVPPHEDPQSCTSLEQRQRLGKEKRYFWRHAVSKLRAQVAILNSTACR